MLGAGLRTRRERRLRRPTSGGFRILLPREIAALSSRHPASSDLIMKAHSTSSSTRRRRCLAPLARQLRPAEQMEAVQREATVLCSTSPSSSLPSLSPRVPHRSQRQGRRPRSLLDQSPFSFQPHVCAFSFDLCFSNFLYRNMQARHSIKIPLLDTTADLRIQLQMIQKICNARHTSFLSECLLEKNLILHWSQLQLGGTSCWRRRRQPTLETTHPSFPELDFVARASG
ncbi:uncharacterized protein [Miscanthus floridulus]|uniref:uncharacterized protein isoform X1 n=1 Tax=Miscanthus floridulus TaxID=154761 RepID=UPI0034576D38